MANMAGKWGYTRGGEMYYGCEDTPEAAAYEGRQALTEEHGEPPTEIEVGEYRAPEYLSAIDGDDLIEQITCNCDDFCGEWAEDAFECSPAQREDLTAMLRATFKSWVDKHGLEPSFGIVGKTKTIKFNAEGKVAAE